MNFSITFRFSDVDPEDKDYLHGVLRCTTDATGFVGHGDNILQAITSLYDQDPNLIPFHHKPTPVELPVISYPHSTPSWLNRVPKEVTETVPEGTIVKIAQSELEKSIVARTHTSKLTDMQRETLYTSVTIANPEGGSWNHTMIKSPIELYISDPLFKKFADEKIMAMAAHSAPNSKIVSTLCAYEAPNGWLNYRKDTLSLQREVQLEQNQYQNIPTGTGKEVKTVEALLGTTKDTQAGS